MTQESMLKMMSRVEGLAQAFAARLESECPELSKMTRADLTLRFAAMAEVKPECTAGNTVLLDLCIQAVREILDGADSFAAGLAERMGRACAEHADKIAMEVLGGE